MKISVIGAGALGSLFGGLLAADSNEVWLLHHRETVAETIADNGVVIEEPDNRTRQIDVRSTVDAARVGPSDLVVVFVKAHQTIRAIEQHKACIGPETRVLSLQNGLTNHYRLQDHTGENRTVHGVTYQSATLEEAGHVRRSSPGPSVFGGSDGTFAGKIATILESAGMEAMTVEDPFTPIWQKQLYSVAIKPLAALTRLSNCALAADDELAQLMYRLMAETAAVARTRDVDLDVDETFEELLDAMAGSTHTSSILQDIRAERTTEIEDINGAVVDIGKEEGIDVPLNEMATALVRGLERNLAQKE